MNTKICYLISCSREEADELDVGRKVAEEVGKTRTADATYNVNINMKSEDFMKYTAHYGHHFNKKLAEYAVSKIPVPSTRIKYEKVEEILAQAAETLNKENTTADLYFEANRMKARHSANTIKSDVHLITLAVERLNDTTDEEVFCEWYNNMKRRGEKIPWKDFI